MTLVTPILNSAICFPDLKALSNISAHHTPINDSNTRPQKRKASALDNQVLELDVLEDQLRCLETQGLG
ncbi:hypothetical protein AYI70_g775 [Smittium culicis]|uniref:Uncharacterized protein n=1 Tax=Smittium culicis TaxID=133412 RepID=A0A1R1YFB6_9FUNG|nr:hypothetical protein AYI70_g775 [Smittium culicis]